MSTPRRKFDNDFKREAVRMVLEDGLTRSEVAKRLGINQTQVGSWVKTFQAEGVEGFRGNGRMRPEEARIKELEKQVKEQQMELDFLKKSAAYFASLKK